MSALNVLTLAISVSALTLSAHVSFRQIRLQNGTFSHSVMAQIWDKMRDFNFQEDLRFVLQELEGHSSEGGISGLPTEAKKHVYSVAYFFQQYAYYIGLGILDRDTVTHVLRGRVIAVWDALEPFIREERAVDKVNGEYLFMMLEHHAAYARQIDGDKANMTYRINPVRRPRVARRLGMKRPAGK